AATALALGLPAGARAQDAPKQGGRLRLGLTSGNTADQGDPATWGTSALVNLGLWGAVYNNLTEIAPDGQTVSELVEAIEPSKDAKTWAFKLRKGVTFRDGKTLDADDVVASINLHRGADSKSAAKAIVSQISEIKADSKDTVIVT